jgi:aspartyl-tRNA(Asn)/glutamyl-tRNA(Gln) amidotransferase subunit A
MASADELLSFDVAALSEKLRRREISPVELAEAYLSRIEHFDKRYAAYITITADHARKAAKEAETEITRGQWRGPFHGIPVALKDLCYTRGILTTGGSRILQNFVPDYDCTLWARLKEQGAILLGKLNLHEFASGATTTNPHWGTCRNPYNPQRIPGGSSGGSGVAIVAKMAAATIGTDTGGSIRIPAAFCGCIGLKQTWSRVSRYGVIPLSDSLDHAGPITRSVRDAALMLRVIAGYDPDDGTSSREPVPDYSAACERTVKGMRVGVIKELMRGPSSEVIESINRALKCLRDLGIEIEEVSIPAIETCSTIATNIMWAESSEYHREWMRSRPEDYGFDVRRSLEAGMLTPAVNYVRAQRARPAVLAQALDAMEGRTVLLAPTAALPAPIIDKGGRALAPDGHAVNMLTAVLRFTAPFNVTGQPALAIPTGMSSDGLPLSMQVIGRPFDEASVFAVAAAYEKARGPLAPPVIQ